MKDNYERQAINSWWKQRAAWTTIGLVAWLGSVEAKQHVSQPRDISNNVWATFDTAEWAGRNLTLVNGVLMTFGGFAVELSYRNGRRQDTEPDLPERRGKQDNGLDENALPMFEFKGREDFRRRLSQSLWEALESTRQEYPIVGSTRDYLYLAAEQGNDFESEVSHLVEHLARKLDYAVNDSGSDEGSSALQEVILAAAFMDRVMPISLECQATPWTEDAERYGHKFWYEYILRKQRDSEPLSLGA